MTFSKEDLQDIACFEANEYIKSYGEEDFDNIMICIGRSIKTLKDLQKHGIADRLTEEECWDRLGKIKKTNMVKTLMGQLI